MAASDRSISVILQDVLRNLQLIVRSEVRLAKTEVREELTKVKPAVMLLAIGAVCGLFGILFLLLTAMYALALALPLWTSAFIVAAVLLIITAITLKTGQKRMEHVHPVPDRTIASMKENAEWARQQTR
jgi:H+/Cl- antiporter ClcA